MSGAPQSSRDRRGSPPHGGHRDPLLPRLLCRVTRTEVPGESSCRSRVPDRGLCRDKLLRVLRSSFRAAERARNRTPCEVSASSWRAGNLWGNPSPREGTPERRTWACLQGGHGVLMQAPSFQVEAGNLKCLSLCQPSGGVMPVWGRMPHTFFNL